MKFTKDEIRASLLLYAVTDRTWLNGRPLTEDVERVLANGATFLQSREKQNIPQALSVFFQQFAGAKWHLMAATAAIAIVPVVVIFLVFQKQFMKGLAEGAVKG